MALDLKVSFFLKSTFSCICQGRAMRFEGRDAIRFFLNFENSSIISLEK